MELTVSSEFETELREELDRFRSIILRGAIAMAIALAGNIVGAVWHASALTAKVEQNEVRSVKNEERLSMVSDEQLRRTDNVKAVAEVKIELKSVKDMLQQVRDDVLIIKANKSTHGPN